MSSEIEIIERLVRRVEDAAERIEDRVNALERESATQKERIVTLFNKLESQSESLEEMTKTMTHWKSGAAILFALGAVAMWVLDHLSTVKKFFFN